MANLTPPSDYLSFPLTILVSLGARTCKLLFFCNLRHNYMVLSNGRHPLMRSIDTHLSDLPLALVQNSALVSYGLHSVAIIDIPRQWGTAE